MTREVVEKMAEDVEQLIAKLKGGDDMTMELLSKSEIAREKNGRLFSVRCLWKWLVFCDRNQLRTLTFFAAG